MNLKNKMLMTVSVMGMMSMTHVYSAHAAYETDSSAYSQSEAPIANAVAPAVTPASNSSAAQSEILKQLKMLQERLDKQGEQIEALKAKNKSLSRKVKKQGKEVKEVKEATTNIGMAEDGVMDAIFESVEEHEGNAHASKLKLGGWADFVYRDRNTTNYKKMMDPHHMYLYLDAKLDPEWRFYGEIEFEHTPQLKDNTANNGTLKVERVYIEHNHSTALNARFGKFNTPLGLWTPEHWLINVPSIDKPIHENNAYVPVKQVGVQLFGNKYSNSSQNIVPDLKYDLWMSKGDQLFETNQPGNDKYGYGFNGSASFADTLTMGVTVYHQDNSMGTAVTTDDRKEKTLHPYIKLDLPHRVSLTGEYMDQRREGAPDIQAWYASAQWWFHDKAYAYYRRDQGDDDKLTAAPDTSHEGNIFTLGFWPKNYVRTKVEYSTHDFNGGTTVNYKEIAAFIGVTF